VRSPWTLIIGDVVALSAFGLLGMASHEESVSLEIIARSTVPFIVSWLFIGGAFGMFGARAQQGTPEPGWFLAAWLTAGITAMIARSLIFDRTLITAFFVIGITGYGLFLAGWRFAYYRISKSRQAERPMDAALHEGTNG
jgi:hypothetical protein